MSLENKLNSGARLEINKPHVVEQLNRFYGPVRAAQNELGKAEAVFFEFVNYLRKDLNVPDNYVLSQDFTCFVAIPQQPTQAPAVEVGGYDKDRDNPIGPDPGR
jgi:hypothetical protein